MPSAEGVRIGAVVVAAGSGRRFGSDGPPKQYRLLGDRPVLEWSVRQLVSHPEVARVVVALPPGDLDDPPRWLGEWPVHLIAGGAQRGDSVRNALAALADEIGYVLVHDGARPFLSRALLDRLVAAAPEPVIPGIPVTDTLKKVDAARAIVTTVDRRDLWRVQTPQAFPVGMLTDCHRLAAEEGLSQTDDAALLERYGHSVRVVDGDPINVKITTVEDFEIAEALARRLPPDWWAS